MADNRTNSEGTNPTLWSMRAVSQRTGLSEHTLRAWEKRFGFPDPIRLESGHRRYPASQVRRLTAIQSALVRGHRIGDVIHLDEAGIDRLLASGTDQKAAPASEERTYLDACLRLDTEALASMLRRDASSLGVTRFLSDKLVPFIRAIGDGWQEGVVSIRHEHVATEIIEGILRELRTPLERGLTGRPVLLATLPGEIHSLGMQTVALMIVARGIPVRVLGVETPVDEILESAIELRASLVAISLTEAGTSPSTPDQLAGLRDGLPAGVSLWIGGAGTPHIAGLSGINLATSLEDIDELVATARQTA